MYFTNIVLLISKAPMRSAAGQESLAPGRKPGRWGVLQETRMPAATCSDFSNLKNSKNHYLNGAGMWEGMWENPLESTL